MTSWSSFFLGPAERLWFLWGCKSWWVWPFLRKYLRWDWTQPSSFSPFFAVLIDKDQSPQWNPPTLEEVSNHMVEQCFSSLGHKDLAFWVQVGLLCVCVCVCVGGPWTEQSCQQGLGSSQSKVVGSRCLPRWMLVYYVRHHVGLDFCKGLNQWQGSKCAFDGHLNLSKE